MNYSSNYYVHVTCEANRSLEWIYAYLPRSIYQIYAGTFQIYQIYAQIYADLPLSFFWIYRIYHKYLYTFTSIGFTTFTTFTVQRLCHILLHRIYQLYRLYHI